MEKMHEVKDLDITKASRGIWLVKVPKYVSDSWSKAPPGSEIGVIKMPKLKSINKDKESSFCVNTITADGMKMPKEHQFNVKKNVTDQNLALLSIEMIPSDSTDPSSALIPAGKVSIEGSVTHRCECKPRLDDTYMAMNKKRLEDGNKPQRQVVQLLKALNNYKPKTNHENNIEYEARKKAEGKKIRMEKDKVMDTLFAAFEKFQYYNVKDLVKITNQPVTYLKEILHEICTYNMKAPNKNTWELKPEFRHYKKIATPSSGGPSVGGGGASGGQS